MRFTRKTVTTSINTIWEREARWVERKFSEKRYGDRWTIKFEYFTNW